MSADSLTLHVDLSVVERPEQGSFRLLVPEDPQKEAGQQGAILTAHMRQSVNDVKLLLQNHLWDTGEL